MVTGWLKSLRITFLPIVYYRITLKFSREFEGLSVPNLSFIGGKASNSLENLKPTNAEFSFRAVIPIGLGGTPSTRFHPFWRCVRQHLSPSCHPCHPSKRVQTPCTSAFCHPDTLFSKKFCMKFVEGWRIAESGDVLRLKVKPATLYSNLRGSDLARLEERRSSKIE